MKDGVCIWLTGLSGAGKSTRQSMRFVGSTANFKEQIMYIKLLSMFLLAVLAVSVYAVARPDAPTNYAAELDYPTTVYLSWVNGAGAVTVRHEFSTNSGVTWSRLDDDIVPVTESSHSLPENSVVYLRAKSVSGSGSSDYAPVVVVVTGTYDPE
jgi:hypothetical protein